MFTFIQMKISLKQKIISFKWIFIYFCLSNGYMKMILLQFNTVENMKMNFKKIFFEFLNRSLKWKYHQYQKSAVKICICLLWLHFKTRVCELEMNKKQNIYIAYASKISFSLDILEMITRKVKVCSFVSHKTHYIISQLNEKPESQVHLDLSILIQIWRCLQNWMMCARFS